MISFILHEFFFWHIRMKFYRKVTNEKDFSIQHIQSDHGTEFENQDFKKFYDEKGIDHNFSASKTSQ